MLKTLTYSEVYLLFPVYPLLPIKELLKKQRNGDNKLAELWMTAISSRRMWRYSLGNDFSSPNWGKNEYSMQKYKGSRLQKLWGKNMNNFLFTLLWSLDQTKII